MSTKKILDHSIIFFDLILEHFIYIKNSNYKFLHFSLVTKRKIGKSNNQNKQKKKKEEKNKKPQ